MGKINIDRIAAMMFGAILFVLAFITATDSQLNEFEKTIITVIATSVNGLIQAILSTSHNKEE
uniref:Holin n=1 Tax=viral metagenome TaxID=1070528 RepID=A0A6M3J5J8_9ZZZZ